jgi:hypothetical protein
VSVWWPCPYVGSVDLESIFKQRFWWLGTLICRLPAWFLHSRTAFRHVVWVGFFAWFLYYPRYRRGGHAASTAFVFGAVVLFLQRARPASATGICCAPMRVITGHVSCTPKLLLAAAVVALLLAAPYIRSTVDNADETVKHLRILDSYWTQPLTLGEKLDRLQQEYRFGLSPDYWFAPENNRDLIRHQMKGYGLLLPVMLPFILLGLLICLKNFRSSPYRVVLIALLVAPVGGVLVATLILRVLIMVIPAALLATLGLIAVLNWLAKRVSYRPLAIGVFAIVGAFNLFMLYDALTYGPTWYTDYGMGGLQYGGQQVFGEIREELKRAPQTQVMISPNWANGTNTLQWFFAPDENRIQMVNIDAYKFSRLPLTDDTLLVMTPDEYARTIDDPFSVSASNATAYQQSAGFFFVRLKYLPGAERSSSPETPRAAGRWVRRSLASSRPNLHSQFDMVRW